MATSKNKRKPQLKLVEKHPYIMFSFRYLTSNKHYNFNYFDNKDIKRCNSAYESFLNLMQALCQTNISEVRMVNKTRGAETIACNQFNSSIQTFLKTLGFIEASSKLIIIRFHSQDYRLICKSDPTHNNLLYILAFDFDYSAYNHG